MLKNDFHERDLSGLKSVIERSEHLKHFASRTDIVYSANASQPVPENYWYKTRLIFIPAACYFELLSSSPCPDLSL